MFSDFLKVVKHADSGNSLPKIQSWLHSLPRASYLTFKLDFPIFNLPHKVVIGVKLIDTSSVNKRT